MSRKAPPPPSLVFKPEDVWRTAGAKPFLKSLSEETGEYHDAAVYDTKYEFDPQNPAAVKYVASVALNKVMYAFRDEADKEKPFLYGPWSKSFGGTTHGRTTYKADMPTDGSVVPIDTVPENDRMLQTYTARKQREDNAQGKGGITYIPDASKYCEDVIYALENTSIAREDYTEEEAAISRQNEEYWEQRHKHYALISKIRKAIIIICALFLLRFVPKKLFHMLLCLATMLAFACIDMKLWNNQVKKDEERGQSSNIVYIGLLLFTLFGCLFIPYIFFFHIM